MDSSLVAAYLSRLLNLEVDKSTRLRLSSAQKIRLFNWLKSNNYKFDVGLLNTEFSVDMLCGSKRLIGDDLSVLGAAETNQIKTIHVHSSIIGMDIQSVSELFPTGLSSDPKSDLDLLGIFTLKELSYAQSKLNPQDTLTGIFAAKEAVIKCGKEFETLSDIEVLPNEAGIPSTSGYAISISHSRDFAVAVAIPVGNIDIQDNHMISQSLDSDTNIKKVDRSRAATILFLTCIVGIIISAIWKIFCPVVLFN